MLVEPHLAAYVDEELDAAVRADVERHLSECRRCREVVRDMRLASAVLVQWRPARPGVPLAETLVRRIRREKVTPERPETAAAGPAAAESPARPRGRARARWALAVATLPVVATLAWLVSNVSSVPARRSPIESVAALVGRLAQVERPEDAADVRLALDAVVADAWASRRPSVGTLIALEVAATLTADATDARGARVVGDVLKRLSEGASRRVGSRSKKRYAVPSLKRYCVPFFAMFAATGEWLGAMLASGTVYADEPPKDLGALLDEATALEEEGDLESAVGKYRLAAEDRLLTLRASILQANVEMKLGRAEAALASLDRAMTLTRPETFYRELIAQLRGRAEEAVALRRRIAELREKLTETERDFDVLSDIGGLQVKAGDLTGAEETFGRLARSGAQEEGEGRRRDVLRARLVRAWCLRELRRHGAAFEEFDRLIGDARETYPEVSTLAQFERAKSLQLRGRTTQALDDYRDLARSVGLDPAAFAALQFQIGYLLLTDLARPDEAVAAFRSLDREGLRDQPFARAALSLARDAGPSPE